MKATKEVKLTVSEKLMVTERLDKTFREVGISGVAVNGKIIDIVLSKHDSKDAAAYRTISMTLYKEEAEILAQGITAAIKALEEK